MDQRSCPLLRKVVFYILASILIVTVLFVTYVGLVTFFYCSTLVVMTYIASMMGYVAMGLPLEIARGVIWLFFGLPLIDAMFIVNWDILTSFFASIWGVLSYEGTRLYMIETLADKGHSRAFNYTRLLLTYCLFGCLSLVLVRAWIIRGPGISAFLSYMLGGISVIVPCIAWLKAFYEAWPTFFCFRERASRSVLVEPIEPVVDENQELVAAASAESEEKEIRRSLSLFDPCQLLRRRHWKDLMNSKCNMFWLLSKGEWTFELIPGIFALCCQIAYTVLDWVSLANEKDELVALDDNPMWVDWLFAVCRLLFAIWSAPFVMTSNFTILFYKWKSLAFHQAVRVIKIVSTFFIWVAFTGILGYGLFFNVTFKPEVLHTFEYISSENDINASRVASFCDARVEGWSIVELAGMAMIAKSDYDNLDLVKNLTDTILGENIFLKATALRGSVAAGFLIEKKGEDSTPVVAYQGAKNTAQIAALTENIIPYWYNIIMDDIIPFFTLMNDIFMKGFMNALANNLGYATLGLRPLSSTVKKDVMDHSQIWSSATERIPIFTGQSMGGLAAKYASGKYDAYSVAFESPMITMSKLGSSITDVDGNPHSFLMTNVYSGLSMFAFSEDNITSNIKLPDMPAFFIPTDEYRTFCLVAAGCATTDAYDRLCSATVGPETYQNYFGEWSRSRAPIA